MKPKDTWDAGDLYEQYVGRWSRLIAEKFLGWLSVPQEKEWLDVGCGTGALTKVIIDKARPRAVTGIDSSSAYVTLAERRIADPRAIFKVGDAQSLPVDSASADVGVSGLVLNFVPEPSLAVRELARAVRPGGVVAAYVWDYAGRMEFMRYLWDVAVALDPSAIELDEGRRFPLCAPGPLAELFAGSGLEDVEVGAIDIQTRFADFDDLWIPFLGGQGPAPGYVMSLDENRRGLLRDELRSRLPIKKDGTIDLGARAWAVRGIIAE